MAPNSPDYTPCPLELVNQQLFAGEGRIVDSGASPKLVVSCPFKSSHKNGDRNPSFAIFASGGFDCKACGATGHWSELYKSRGLEAPGPDSPLLPAPPGKPSLAPALVHLGCLAAVNAIKSGLNQEARKELKERKFLLKAEIDALEGFGYRSLPTELLSRRQVGRAVQDALKSHDVSLLPVIDKTGAFCRIQDTPDGGILVPIRRVCTDFAAFKVRRNGVRKAGESVRKRYSWFPGGTHEIHARVAVGARRILVIEGPLGADIVLLLWPVVFGEAVSVIGLPSATSHAGLVEVLKEMALAMGVACPEIGLCLDLDEAGRTGTEAIKELLDPTSLLVSVASWPGSADLPEFLAKSRNEARDLVTFTPVPKTQPVPAAPAPLLPPTAFETLG